MKKIGVIFPLIFIYFIGPQLWGLWMVYKLNIISIKDCFYILTSPITLIVLFVFFVANCSYINRSLKRMLESKEIAREEMNNILKFHLFSIMLFGGIATLLGAMSLLFPNPFFPRETLHHDFKTILNCYLSGASLSYMFFIFFSNMLAKNIRYIALEHYSQNVFSYNKMNLCMKTLKI